MDKMIINRRILITRKARRISQMSLANNAGIHHSCLHKIEVRRFRPKDSTIEKLSGPLGVTYSWLKTGRHTNSIEFALNQLVDAHESFRVAENGWCQLCRESKPVEFCELSKIMLCDDCTAEVNGG